VSNSIALFLKLIWRILKNMFDKFQCSNRNWRKNNWHAGFLENFVASIYSWRIFSYTFFLHFLLYDCFYQCVEYSWYLLDGMNTHCVRKTFYWMCLMLISSIYSKIKHNLVHAGLQLYNIQRTMLLMSIVPSEFLLQSLYEITTWLTIVTMDNMHW